MMNYAALPTDTSYGNTSTKDLINTLYQSYKNSIDQKDMQKQKAMQDAMQYAQPFGSEQDQMQQQMKMLQGYRPPEVQMPQAPSAAQMKEIRKGQQQAALAKYLNSGSNDQSNQSSQPTTDESQYSSQGQMPSINTNAKYGQSSPNPMLMDGGLQPGQQPARAVPAQLTQQTGPMQALQQGMQQPSPQQNSPVDYSNIDTLPSSGNPKMDELDKAWLQNPSAVENAFGVSGKKSTYNNPTTGEQIITTTLPSGRTKNDVIQVGKTNQQKSFESEIGKANAAQYETAMNNVNQADEINTSLDQMIAMKDNPELKNVIGKYGAPTIAAYFGNPEQKEILGKLEATSGKIVLDMINSMKGASSDRDVAFVNKMKPNTSDPVDVFYGKVNALKVTEDLISQRNELKANLIQQGVSPVAASRAAQNKFPIEKIQSEVDAMLDPKIWIKSRDGKQVQVPRSIATKDKMKVGGWEYV